MKICTRCRNTKSFDLFAKRSRSSDGLSSWCKECFAENAKTKYQTSSEERERKKRNRDALTAANQDKLWELLTKSSCPCGESDPEVLEFDHIIQDEKLFNVSEMIYYCSWDRILQEISKCNTLCVKCHRKKTIQQFGYWKALRRNKPDVD